VAVLSLLVRRTHFGFGTQAQAEFTLLCLFLFLVGGWRAFRNR
jgi:hypothetical protein